MALFGSLAALRAQAPRTEGFVTAFNYIDELMRAGSAVQTRLRGLAAGERERQPLSGGAFVIEEAYPTKLRADGFFESHRKFIDVQFVFEGEELMEVIDLGRIKERQPYNPDRDLIVYEDTSEASLLRVYPGHGTIFFPSDVHMPTLRIRNDPVLVRKIVVKIPVA